jgi:hypothetical protein
MGRVDEIELAMLANMGLCGVAIERWCVMWPVFAVVDPVTVAVVQFIVSLFLVWAGGSP